MSSLKQFLLFDKVQFLKAYEHIEYLEDGNIKYPPEAAYYLHYAVISLDQDTSTPNVVEEKNRIKIDLELDPEQNSSKDGISFCKNHNDRVFKVILGKYKSILKEDSSYKNESIVTNPQLVNYEFIVAKFRDWYRRNEIPEPDFDNVDEFLRIKTSGNSFLETQDKIIRKLNRSILKNSQPSKKDYDKEARQFLNVAIKTNNSWPELKELEKITNKSKPTWSRRLNNLVFLSALITLVIKREENSSNQDKLGALFGNIKAEISMRISKLEIKKNQKDIYSKSKRIPFDDNRKSDP